MEQRRMARTLKILTICVAFVGALFVFWYMPAVIRDMALMYPEAGFLKWPGMFGVGILGVLGFAELWLFYRICGRIGEDNSFCMENAADMKRIGIFGGISGILMAAGMGILIFTDVWNGAVLIFFLFVEFAVWAFVVLCRALAKLIRHAAELKAENDLTI